MTDADPPVGQRRRGAWRALLAVSRWLHIYLSMLGFGVVLFFAVTGLTLNHRDWFGAGPDAIVTETRAATIALPRRGGELDRLALVELLRREHGMIGGVTSCEADEYEVRVVFKRPGMVADVVIDAETEEASLLIERSGAVAVINDLHMGRHSGAWWSLVIDVSAVLMALSALTGLVLLCGLPKRRRAGLLVGALACAVAAAVGVWLVP